MRKMTVSPHRLVQNVMQNRPSLRAGSAANDPSNYAVAPPMVPPSSAIDSRIHEDDGLVQSGAADPADVTEDLSKSRATVEKGWIIYTDTELVKKRRLLKEKARRTTLTCVKETARRTTLTYQVM